MTAGTSSQPTGRSQREILADAVRVLTEAARDTRDFAEFVTLAVAGAAANVGGIEQALAGRPGSWEADKVRDLLHSTVGCAEEHLLAHRTEPIILRVRVDDVLDDLGYADLYHQADQDLSDRETAICTQADHGRGVVEFTAEQDAAIDEIDALRERLDQLRQDDRAAYGQAFQANVLRAAAELMPNLTVPVQVVVDTTRRYGAEPDTGEDPDTLAYRLWEHARDHTPLPGSGIPLNNYPTGADIAQTERDAGRTPLARLQNPEATR